MRAGGLALLQEQKYAKGRENQHFFGVCLAFLKHILRLLWYKKATNNNTITKKWSCFSPNNRNNKHRNPTH